jgi:hypothetical protein
MVSVSDMEHKIQDISFRESNRKHNLQKNIIEAGGELKRRQKEC